MDRPVIRAKGPEAIIQADLKRFLEVRGWFVMETHGNMYQRGFADMYCTHPTFKQRWVEVKNAESYAFTQAQLECFPEISKAVGIWVLVAATTAEYAKLFKPPNWWQYLSEAKIHTRRRKRI